MTDSSSFDTLRAIIESKRPGFRFEWEIYTDLVLENVRRCPRWLDIGAGSNIWIREQPGAELAVGIDLERPSGLALQPGEAYCLAEGERLPFKDASFDFVSNRFVIEHLKTPLAVLAEIDRVLKPSGVVLLQTTNKANPLIIAARLVPFDIKKRLLRWLFGDVPSGVYKTYYKMNRPGMFKERIGNLRLEQIILTDVVFMRNRAMFAASFAVMRLLETLGLKGLKANIIAVYRKSNA